MKKTLLYLTMLWYCTTITAQCYSTFIGHAFKYYALKTDGTLWIKGFNTSDYFGLGNTNTIPEFIQFGTDSDWTPNIAQGEYFTLAIKTNGTLWSWGRAIAGAGGGNATQTTDAPYTQPTQLGTDSDWAKVVSSDFHTLAIKTNGTLWVWGNNADGNFGIPTFPLNANSYTPLQVGTDGDWSEVYAGKSSTGVSCAIKTNGTLWTWGGNGIRIGYPNASLNDNYRSPHQIGSTTWKTAAVGGATGVPMFFGIKTDGTLWGWGTSGAITGAYYFGNGQATYSSEVPEQIGNASDWEKIVTHYATSIALKIDGSLWGWGRNTGYQLGLGTGNNSNILFPTQIGTDTDWQIIHLDTYAGGGGQLLSIKNDTSIYHSGYYNPAGTLDVVPTLFSAIGCNLGINENTQSHLFMAYPNPFIDTITFKLNESENNFQLLLYNQLGQELKNIKVNISTYTLNTSTLPIGIYVVLINTNGKQASLKICKH